MPIKKTKDEKKDSDKKVKSSSSKTQPKKDLAVDVDVDVVDSAPDVVSEEISSTTSVKKDDQSVTEKGEYQAPRKNNYSGGGYSYSGNTIKISGILEVLTDYGVIRQNQESNGSEDLPKDVYISHSQIKRFGLRMGDTLTGLARPPKENERYLSLLKIETVGGEDPEKAKKRPMFSKLVPIFPNEWLKLETKSDVISTRLIDLISPIGKGQRAMLVAPPKAGKTFLLLDVANGITTNYPDVTLLVALIGERPEEVTHFARSVKGEVFASNFDEKAEDQTRISELCLEKAKRLAETGKDVVILMDSITRLARAYNMVAPPSGRTLTGGFDPAALYPAKHFFGAARNLENSGSLTIIATALVDTGSRMDDVIFEEFKGTGNMELRLDRSLAERRIFPAIDIKGSSTRHEEVLFDKDTLEKVYRLRRMVDLLEDRDVTPLIIEQLKKTKDNKEFLDTLNKGGV
jgi:transcription termination factor Rho